jgi:hypothetical protein
LVSVSEFKCNLPHVWAILPSHKSNLLLAGEQLGFRSGGDIIVILIHLDTLQTAYPTLRDYRCLVLDHIPMTTVGGMSLPSPVKVVPLTIGQNGQVCVPSLA